MHRKDKVLEALRLLCTQQFTHNDVPPILRRHTGFSAEEVGLQAAVDRTNASRDLNQLALEGSIVRIPGRPVLFYIDLPSSIQPSHIATLSASTSSNRNGEMSRHVQSQIAVQPREENKSAIISASLPHKVLVTSFETLIGHNEGLKVAVQQAKAAILYPPHGLHTLLYGPSGVGKTTMAKLMHSFALEQDAISSDAPFVSFNCADYAGNPQLLMAHLFGVVKGAYTGADKDRVGLVEEAHQGILFLDEVHRLPPEGQEMLFYLMDRERFRRLGDTHERQASLLLLAATTEDPAISLLPTFRRRIPMTITLPGLHERTTSERYELIRAFFTTECSSIGVSIHVAPAVLRALLLYDCVGNIGQLHTDIQLTCAHAYLDYRTHNLPELHVLVDALPEHVRHGLLRTAELHRALEPLQHVLDTTHSFTPTGLQLGTDASRNLYTTISNELSALRSSGLSEQEIHQLLHFDIQHYFQRFADTLPNTLNGTSTIEQQGPSDTHNIQDAPLVDERIMTMSHSIIHYAEGQLHRTFPEKLALVLTLHLMSAIEHSKQGQQPDIPVLQAMRHTYPIEYEVARVALLNVRSSLDIALPESETDVLTVLLANADTLLNNDEASIGIIVAAHGRGVASGFAELANTLTGVDGIASVELTLDQSPEELLTRVEQCITTVNHGRGVLLLVDFASLLSLGELITQRTGIQVRTLANVSMPLVVEAVRGAQRHTTLDQLASSLRREGASQSREQYMQTPDQTGYVHTSVNVADIDTSGPRVILSVCLTGYGSATKLAELIEDRLPELRQQGVETLCMDINLSSKTEADIQRLVGNRQIVAIVGTINPRLENYPFLSLTEVLFGDGISRLRTLLGNTLIDPMLLQRASTPTLPTTPTFSQRSDLLHEISYTLSQRMLFLNPMRALPLIESMIELIEVEVGESFELEVLAGFVLHIACILEYGHQQPAILVSETVRQRIEKQFPRELSICRHALQVLSSQVARPLPDEEAYNIVGILRQVDIFFGQE